MLPNDYNYGAINNMRKPLLWLFPFLLLFYRKYTCYRQLDYSGFENNV